MFKKRALNQDATSASKAKLERGGGSPILNSTCSSCRKKHVRKCLLFQLEELPRNAQDGDVGKL